MVVSCTIGSTGVIVSVLTNLDGVHDDLKTLNSKTSSFPKTVTVQVPENTQRELLMYLLLILQLLLLLQLYMVLLLLLLTNYMDSLV